MKRLLALCIAIAVMLPFVSAAQVQNAEMTTAWDNSSEYLVDEDGNIPDFDARSYKYLGRIRLQDKRMFPMYELQYSFRDFADNTMNPTNMDLSDLRFAMLRKLPWAGLSMKAIYMEQNLNESEPGRHGGAYLYGDFSGIQFGGGFDHSDVNNNKESQYSLRLKYRMGSATLMAGGSHQPDNQMKFTGGGMVELPGQFLLGGLFGYWTENSDMNLDTETGYAVNVGRYNQFGDFAGLPSFSLNYIEVPNSYKWTNFRLMWGAAGIHYVPPTFSNGVFAGQYDIDMALMLSPLLPDNYRFFDSPLIFKRYDEYGKYAFRVNHIEVESGFRKFDANISANPGIDFGVLKSVRGIFTVEHIHNPVFGWQDLRYHLTAAAMLKNQVYTGITYSDDFNRYQRIMLEIRLYTGLQG